MNQAAIYQRANQMQRNDAKNIINEEHLQWRLDGGDRLLDVGCGSGDVLMDYIYPLLPKNFELLLGTDISTKMVDYASESYSHDERIQFRVLDIAVEALPRELCAQFDHVTSFYCLHWVQNQRKALENIYNLLRQDGGDCLLVFLASAPLYDIYKALSERPKWAAFMRDMERYISPLHFSKDPLKEFKALLSETGFVDCNVELRNRVHYFRNAEVLQNSIKAICPFLERMSFKEERDFLDEILNCVKDKKLYEVDGKTKELKFFTPYKLIVAYARKTSSFFSGVIGNKGAAKEDLRTK